MQQRFLAPVLLVITALLWSLGGVLIKSIDWPPMAIAAGRSIAAIPVLLASAGQQHRNRSNTSTSGNRHWRPVNGLDQHASQTPEQRCYHQKNWSEEALLHS